MKFKPWGLWRPSGWHANRRIEWSLELACGIYARVYFGTDKKWRVLRPWHRITKQGRSGFATAESAMLAAEGEIAEQIKAALAELRGGQNERKQRAHRRH